MLSLLAFATLTCLVPSVPASTLTPVPSAGSLTPASTGITAVSPTTSPTTPPAPTVTHTPAAPYSPRLIAYFFGSNHYNRLADVPFSRLTVLIYAFINVSKDGLCASDNPALDEKNFAALREIKKQFPNLEILLSVGGYAHSAYFSDAAASEDSRRAFAQSCLSLLAQAGFDGLDIDWETPVSGGLPENVHRPEDKQNFTLLLLELRRALDAQAKSRRPYRLSVALPAVSTELDKFEPDKFAPAVDWITLMAYAYFTSESKITHLNASLYPVQADPDRHKEAVNGNAAVQAYLSAGIPPQKIALGVPFYGRAWKDVPPANDGLFQPAGGPFVDLSFPEVWSKDGEITYKGLSESYLSTWPRYWQAEAVQPWLYNPALEVMVTYDDPQSLGLKTDYVRSNQLGGVAIWQINGDDAQHSLVGAIYTHLYP